MKLSLTTPNTLIFGIWNEAGLCATKGAYRNANGEMIANIYQNYDEHPWRCLNQALTDCKAMRLPNLVMVCNDAQMVKLFTRPIRLPAMSTKEVMIPMQGWSKEQPTIHTRTDTRVKRDLTSVTVDGKKTAAYPAETIDQVDTYLWGFARMLMRWNRWLMIHAASIPATQAYWQECQKEPANYYQLDDLFD